jgi:hypothetical protein
MRSELEVSDAAPPERPGSRPVRSISDRLSPFADIAALAVIALALALEISTMRERSFSADEALEFGLVNVPGPIEAWRRVLTNTHPPIFLFLLHFWMRLGRSEFFLRLLPLVMGGVCLWFVYRWAGRLLGRTAGFVALLVMASSSVFRQLSGEVRVYSCLLMLLAAALYQLEGALETRSSRKMLFFSLLLYLAILTHYAALFILGTVALYGSIRLWQSRAPRKLVRIWVGFLAGAAGLCSTLYFTHLKELRGSAMEAQAMNTWLRAAYFHRDDERALSFITRQGLDMFHYFFGSLPGAAAALLLALGGVILLAARKRFSSILLATPLLLGASAGLLDFYPFGGTRHSIYLLPFVSAAIGALISVLAGKRGWTALPAAVVFVSLSGKAPAWDPECVSRASMSAAVQQLKRSAPEGSVLFTDYRAGLLLSYYLGRDEPNSERRGLQDFWQMSPGGYCLIHSSLWTPDPKSFSDEVERAIKVYRLSPGHRFWAVRSGGEYDLTLELARLHPGSVFPVISRFRGLSVAEVWPWDDSGSAIFPPSDPPRRSSFR